MITEYILQFDEFLRSVAQNSNARYSFLLGAGASVECDKKCICRTRSRKTVLVWIW